jgi:hypothetical protein
MIIGQGKIHHLKALVPGTKLGHYGNSILDEFPLYRSQLLAGP